MKVKAKTRMRSADQTREMIDQKAAEIRQSPEQVDSIIYKTAQDIVGGRTSRSFHDYSYLSSYGEDEIQRRPFLNIGPGSFRHPMWRTADKTYGSADDTWTSIRRGVAQPSVDYAWDIYENQPLQEEDGFFKVIYISHVIEHLFPSDLAFLLAEVRRLLQRGGTLRLVCPNAGLLAQSYKSADWQYFLHYLIVKTNRIKSKPSALTEQQKREISAHFVVDWVSLLANKENPLHFAPPQCVQFLDGYASLFDAFDAAGSLSSREMNARIGGHVNWFDQRKIMHLLVGAGFKNIRASACQQSQVPILRDPRYFDRTDPEMSLYVEAEV
jgi:SAM-dependent methyltransferase